MEDETDSYSPSIESSIDSITECVNAAFFESELETSSVQSITVTEAGSNNGNTLGIVNSSLEMFARSDAASETKTCSKFRFRIMYFVALAALTHAISAGFGVAYTATATEDMNRTTSAVRPTEDEISWIGSLFVLGAAFGGIAAGMTQWKTKMGLTLILSW